MIKITHEDNMDLMARYSDNYFDLHLTDPPYGVGLNYNTYDDTLENWHDLMLRWIPEAKRISRMLVFPSCSINKMKWLYDNFPPDWIMCWYKGSTGHSAYIGFNDWEPLFVYGKLKEVYFHDVIKVLNIEKMGNHNHPCPKPVKWFDWFYSKLDKIDNVRVIDTFLGSGTAAISAHNWGLDLTACELDKDYYESAIKRLKEHQSQLRIF